MIHSNLVMQTLNYLHQWNGDEPRTDPGKTQPLILSRNVGYLKQQKETRNKNHYTIHNVNHFYYMNLCTLIIIVHYFKFIKFLILLLDVILGPDPAEKHDNTCRCALSRVSKYIQKMKVFKSLNM